jgi:hypothetical protein
VNDELEVCVANGGNADELVVAVVVSINVEPAVAVVEPDSTGDSVELLKPLVVGAPVAVLWSVGDVVVERVDDKVAVAVTVPVNENDVV